MKIVCFMNKSVYESFFFTNNSAIINISTETDVSTEQSSPRARDHSMLSNNCLLEWFVE